MAKEPKIRSPDSGWEFVIKKGRMAPKKKRPHPQKHRKWKQIPARKDRTIK